MNHHRPKRAFERAEFLSSAEGRGIRIDVISDAVLKDIRELIDIKLKS